MIYIWAKIIEIREYQIVAECSGIGYHGYYLGHEVLENNKDYRLFVLRIKNDFIDQFFFFDNSQQRGVAKILLEIKNFGCKSLTDLFTKLGYSKLLEFCKQNDINSIVTRVKIHENLAKEVVRQIRTNIFKIKYNKKQMLVINSLHKLGYKVSDIYKVLQSSHEQKNVELMIKEALIKLNEVQ